MKTMNLRSAAVVAAGAALIWLVLGGGPDPGSFEAWCDTHGGDVTVWTSGEQWCENMSDGLPSVPRSAYLTYSGQFAPERDVWP